MIWQSSKNYSKLLTLDTKSRQQCRVRDQEYIIIVSAIYIPISLWFETSALQRYKYDKHAYPLRFVTSWIWQTVSFPVYFQRRFRQGPHQNLKKNNNCQVHMYSLYVSQSLLFVSFDLASSKPLKRYSIAICEFRVSILKAFESSRCCWFQRVICIFIPEASARNTICT